MGCPTHEQMLLNALGLERDAEVIAHLQACRTCREQVEAYRALPRGFAARLTRNEPDHETAKQRLMAALPDRYPSDASNSRMDAEFSRFRRTRLKEILMRHRFALGGTAAMAAVVLFVVWTATWSSPLSAMERTAQAIRNVKSFQFDCVGFMESGPDTPAARATYYVEKDLCRVDMILDDEVTRTYIFAKDEPARLIDHRSKTIARYNAKDELTGMAMMAMIASLGKFSGEADQDLGSKLIGGIQARGFRIAIEKVIPNASDGIMTVWVAPKTNLPVLVEVEDPLALIRLENFKWNLNFSPDLFNPKLPADYAELHGDYIEFLSFAKPDSAEETNYVTGALSIYANAFDGTYPQSIVTAEVIPRLREKLGLPQDCDPMDVAVIGHKSYPFYYAASLGFHTIDAVRQRAKADFGYFGATVGPKDAQKVLIYWRLEGGDYRVIHADLKSKTVAESALRSLLQ